MADLTAAFDRCDLPADAVESATSGADWSSWT